MADDDSVTIRFGAKLDELIKGIDEVKSQFKGLSSAAQQVQSDFEGMGDKLESVFDGIQKQFADLNRVISEGGVGGSTGWLKALLGGGAVGAAAVGIIDVFVSINREMRDTARNAKEVGLELDKFQSLRFAAALSGVNAKEFVSDLEKASTHLGDLGHKTTELSKFLDENNVKYKDANGDLVSMDRYIQIASDLIRNATTEADKFKAADLLGFSRKWVELLEKSPQAMQALIAKAHEAGAVLTNEQILKAAEFEKQWTEASARWANTFKSTIIDMTPYIATFIDIMKSGLAEVWEKTKGIGQNISDWYNRPGVKEAFDQLLNGPPGTGGARDTATGDPFAAASRVLSDIQTKVGVLHGEWKAMVEEADRMGLVVVDALERSLPSKGTVFPAEKDTDAVRASIEEMHGQIRLAQIEFASLSQTMTANVANFATTEAQKTAILLAALNKRRDLELTVAAEELNDAELSLTQRQRIVNTSLEAEAKFAADQAKLIADNLKATVKLYESILTPIQSAWDSQLRGLLARTTTWQQAMKNIFADLLLDLIKAIESFFVRKAALMLAQALGPDPVGLAAAMKGIETNLGQAYAGFAAFYAPLLGPGAPAAALAATAEVGATAVGLSVAGAAEEGAWNIPSTSPWLLHKGEMVLPAPAATAFRAMAETGGVGGRGDTHLHFSIQAWDGRDVARAVPQLARMIQSHMNNNPTTFGR